MLKIAMLLVVASFLLAVNGQTVRVHLSGRNFAPGDLIWGAPDPYVKVGYAVGSDSYSEVGRTKTLHTHNPVWQETFSFYYNSAQDQRLQFEVIEADAFFDDHYGTVRVTLAEVHKAPGRKLERDFGKGVLVIENIA